MKANGMQDRIRCIRTALGDKPSSTEIMELNPDNYGDHRIRNRIAPDAKKTVEVPGTTLRELMGRPDVKGWIEPVSLVWMDVQGSEGLLMKDWPLGPVPSVIEVWPWGMARLGVKSEEFLAAVSKIWNMARLPKDGTVDAADIDMKGFGEKLPELIRSESFYDVLFR